MVNMRIETLRGLACVLLVLYHVIGADPAHGLLVNDGPVRWLNDGLAYLRMPLFTFLSGLVYGIRPFTGDSRKFLVGKVRRLLVPMLVVGTLFALLQAVTPGTNSVVGPWYLLHLMPVGHFWFVESLFWVFLLIWALERRNLMGEPGRFMLVLMLACVLYLTVRGWRWLGIEGAIYLLPYFLVGLACSRFALGPYLTNVWIQSGLVLLAFGAVLLMGMPVANPDRRTVLMLVTGVSLCLLFLSLGWVSSWLAGIGRHSYAIYLFHVFFTASARIAIHLTPIDSLLLDIPVGLVMGLAGPMLIDRVASNYKWAAALLLGKKIKNRLTLAPS
jgi:peptidoglycan/LPS O-acetylase OafA/YrhL